MKSKHLLLLVLPFAMYVSGCSKKVEDEPVPAVTVVSSACDGFITDIDNNNYNIISIGNQCWTQSNLNVTRYRNGDIIPEVQDAEQWANLTTGAWCYYANSTANGTVYGKLYNWHAVNDPRGLAPTGWHVPSLDEFVALMDYLGGQDVAGGKMKSTGTQYWTSPNTDATNESGFSGLPGGVRGAYGPSSATSFSSIGIDGNWWISTVDGDSQQPLYITLYYNYSILEFDGVPKTDGHSVRCIRD
jgi:uncharacterized protein (TIGR02145 family)